MDSAMHPYLSWDYDDPAGRIMTLYERAKNAQWNASDAVDWTLPVAFGEELSGDSQFGISSFEASPLASRGKPAWTAFRWEFQSWMVSQFLHGEQGALVATARLAQEMPDVDCKLYASTQVVDEARHVEAFSRYLREHIPSRYEVSAPLSSLMQDLLSDSRWDIAALGMQILIEALALAAFRTANATFNDDLIKQITALVSRDEARHVSFGVLALDRVYRDLTAAELRDREDFVLTAASLMRQRFLLEEIWERMEVPRKEGADFALRSPLMIAYRRTIFAKVVTALDHIGLLTDRVRGGLAALGLTGPARAAR
jgi:hypothetical protein